MARHDDRNRVGAERVARGTDGPRAAGLAGDGGVGARRAEADPRGCAQHVAGEPAAERPVDRQVEGRTAPLEVLVQLATYLVETLRRLEDPRRELAGEVLHDSLLAREGEPRQSARGGGHE